MPLSSNKPPDTLEAPEAANIKKKKNGMGSAFMQDGRGAALAEILQL